MTTVVTVINKMRGPSDPPSVQLTDLTYLVNGYSSRPGINAPYWAMLSTNMANEKNNIINLSLNYSEAIFHHFIGERVR